MKGIRKPKPTISAAQLKAYRKKRGGEIREHGPRKFDGKVYQHYRSMFSKLDRDIAIKNLQYMGYKYRTVTKSNKGCTYYSVYKTKR